MKHVYLLLVVVASICCLPTKSYSQCDPGESEIQIIINPDNYPAETSWDLVVNGTMVLSGNATGNTTCVPNDACVRFTIYDSYGDGICCAYGSGSYSVLVDGVVSATGGNFDYSEQKIFNCGPGTYCENAIPVTTGVHSAPDPNTFYKFTCTQTGVYEVTTCGMSDCDTKLWVYGACNSQTTSETNVGTLFFDDNSCNGGTQARIEGYMEAGHDYIVRVGLATGATCAADTIAFAINFLNEITGCMDPTACNYNPLATLAGQCYFYPDPNCPDGPDLELDQQAIINSLTIRTEMATNCMVVEGCLNGYGQRTVLAFDTHIRNIGAVDYYVGNPNANPSQFTFNNCHGHAHYEGYADYILYKPDGTPLPIGQKNGFCVMDLECGGGGSGQYGCSNMGISAGCGDIYHNSLDCQWIDITDVDTGQYVLAVKVNWDQSPDALGRYEMGYENNWAQACIKLTKDANGVLGFQVLQDCPPLVDCNGTPYGNAVVDCNGDCDGTAIRGDVDNSGSIQPADASAYITGILDGSLSVSECRDISADNKISVWDAALALNCGLYGNINNYCEFPISVVNETQEVAIGYTTINTTEQYIDVYIQNPVNRVSGYEFTVSGITIGDVESRVDQLIYPVTPRFTVNGTKVIGLSLVDSTIPKNLVPAPLVRIYYNAITDPDNICVQSVVHILNTQHEPVGASVALGCLSVLGMEKEVPGAFSLYPNPATSVVTVTLSEKAAAKSPVSITDMNGKKVYESSVEKGVKAFDLPVKDLPAGTYKVRWNNGAAAFIKQ